MNNIIIVTLIICITVYSIFKLDYNLKSNIKSIKCLYNSKHKNNFNKIVEHNKYIQEEIKIREDLDKLYEERLQTDKLKKQAEDALHKLKEMSRE